MSTTTSPHSRASRARRFDADAFRAACEDAGLSIQDLADLTDISPSTLYKLQQGHIRKPRPANLKKIRLALRTGRGSLLMSDEGSDR